ncbi:hypothetical protein M8C21_005279 [Ambrosia artemisiifolia]|uniref:Post-GPI attachment to proteins factor 3 n=1 Tax=Ambrosia artemisiifolia TaxID=4212 RepID=A0AAD5CEM1_AMBAR|nr:hypothetical protein M8C21_005279 [Ambrosia artemisiifolia]
MTSDGKSVGDPWYLQEPLYIKWKKWDCLSGCRYQCMLVREEEREKAGGTPVKYHGKWPLKRAFGIEEPVAVALSALNLAVQFHGWQASSNPLVVLVVTDVEMTKRLNCSSAAALLGFSLVVAILRAINVRSQATRVMVSAPIIAFMTTHILYLNCYQFDYGEILF